MKVNPKETLQIPSVRVLHRSGSAGFSLHYAASLRLNSGQVAATTPPAAKRSGAAAVHLYTGTTALKARTEPQEQRHTEGQRDRDMEGGGQMCFPDFSCSE